MAETVIERCARAICAEAFGAEIEGSPIDCEGYYFTHQGKAKAYARAVLLALREPSEGMIEAGGIACAGSGEHPTPNRATVAFQAMIDAALTEKV